jgi:hypothetical protein
MRLAAEAVMPLASAKNYIGDPGEAARLGRGIVVEAAHAGRTAPSSPSIVS